MNKAQQREFITTRIFARIARDKERRDEALRDVLGLTVPHLHDKLRADIAADIPELPDELYHKWIGMFADRLLETVRQEDVLDLCRETPESDASLLLVYVMFMESARMEKVVEEDIRELGRGELSDEERATLAETWRRLRLNPPAPGNA